MTPLLDIRGLCKTYDTGTNALRDVTFRVERGEFLVIIGLSGSGKSTLLRCLNHLTKPSAGEVRLDGRRMDDGSLRAWRRRMGMVFQHFNLVPRRSVLDNVLFGRSFERTWWHTIWGLYPSGAKVEAERCIEEVGLSDVLRHRVERLSGGQQQRVAIARALFQRPDLILADEPVASLDPATAHTIMDLLARANRERGLTVVCNLHFLSLVRRYATRVIALRAGELVFDGPPTSIDAGWFKRIYGEDAKDVTVD